MNETNADNVEQALDDYLSFLEGEAPRPTLEHLDATEEAEVRELIRFLEATRDADRPLPPLDADPVAIKHGYVTAPGRAPSGMRTGGRRSTPADAAVSERSVHRPSVGRHGRRSRAQQGDAPDLRFRRPAALTSAVRVACALLLLAVGVVGVAAGTRVSNTVASSIPERAPTSVPGSTSPDPAVPGSSSPPTSQPTATTPMPPGVGTPRPGTATTSPQTSTVEAKPPAGGTGQPTPAGHGVLYGVDAAGRLLWYRHNDPGGGSPGFANNGAGTQVGSGWDQFVHVFSGGDGVIYAVNAEGELFWYRHNDPRGGSPGFANGGVGSRIGVGWNRFTHLFSDGRGVIYAVDGSGRLFWYRHNDPAGGSPGFVDNGAGRQIGIGWNRFTHLFSGGSGIIYAADAQGELFWYRHNDPAGGSAGFANNGSGTPIGRGWGRFTHMLSGGAGVIYAIDGSGRLFWYRHNDPRGGSPGFADNGSGRQIGVGFSAGVWLAPTE